MGSPTVNLSAITGKWIKMKKTIPAGIAVHHLGFHHAGPNHFFGRFSIIGLLLFCFFACQADGLVIEDGEDALVPGGQLRVASLAGNRTGQLMFPLVIHGCSPLR
jgi:hypothetical protein